MRVLFSFALVWSLTCIHSASVSADFLEIELSGQIGALTFGDDLHGLEGADFVYKYLFDLTEPPDDFTQFGKNFSRTEYDAIGGYFRLTGSDDRDGEFQVGDGIFEMVSLINRVNGEPDSLSLHGLWEFPLAELHSVYASVYLPPDFFAEDVTDPVALMPFENSQVLGFDEFRFLSNSMDSGYFEVVDGFARARIVVPEPGVMAVLAIACMIMLRNRRRNSYQN